MGTTPGLIYGQIPTAAQWNGYFGRKLDDLGAVHAEPGDGATLESAIEQGGWLLEPPGLVTVLNIIAPPGTFEGQRFTISTTQDIVNLTVTAAAGGDVLNGGTIDVLAASGAVSWYFRFETRTWYRWSGA